MTLIPAAIGEEIAIRAAEIDLNKMELCLFIRDVALPKAEPSHGEMEQFWKEAAGWARGRKPDTLRKDVQSLRAFPAHKLIKWHEDGLSFDHLSAAVYCSQNTKKGTYAPEQVLDWCVENAVEVEGSDPPRCRPKTVLQMEGHFLGESNQTAMELIEKAFLKLSNFPKLLRWDADKSKRFMERMAEIRKEFFDE